MKKDYYLSFVVLLQLIVTTFQLLLPIYRLTSVDYAATLRIVVTLATYLPGLFIVIRRRPKAVVVSVLFCFMFFLLNYALFPHSHTFLESRKAFTLTPISILTVLYIYSINDFSVFLRMLLYISRACPIVAILYVFGTRNIPANMDDFTYSMSYGYSFLLPTLFLFRQHNLVDKILSFILFLTIVADASRGPAVVILLFYAYDILFGEKGGKGKIKSLIFFVILGLGLSFMILKSEYMSTSRTVILYQNGELLTHESGREDLYIPAWKYIDESPIIGWGVGSDWDLLGFYVHNVFIEIFLHYGYIGGGILFLIFFYYILKVFFSKRSIANYGGREFLIMMVLFGFFPLLRSGSYLIEINFAVLVGYLISINTFSKYRHSKKLAYV